MGLRPGDRGRAPRRPGHHPAPAPGPAAGGLAYIPEDRQEDGIVPDFSVADNLVLDTYDRPPYAKRIAMDLRAIREHATRLADEFDIRTSSIDTLVGTLSGGNQQKVILAREVGAAGPAAAGQPAHPGPGRRDRSSSCTAGSSRSATRASR